MANFRRKRRRGLSTRDNSSDYVYPRIEKGSKKRSRYTVARWVAKWNDQIKQYLGG